MPIKKNLEHRGNRKLYWYTGGMQMKKVESHWFKLNKNKKPLKIIRHSAKANTNLNNIIEV